MKTMEDWYQVTQQQVIDRGGYSLLKSFNNSFVQAITSIYSDYNWMIWKFKRVPAGSYCYLLNLFLDRILE